MNLHSLVALLRRGIEIAEHSYRTLLRIEQRLAAIERLLAEQNARPH